MTVAWQFVNWSTPTQNVVNAYSCPQVHKTRVFWGWCFADRCQYCTLFRHKFPMSYRALTCCIVACGWSFSTQCQKYKFSMWVYQNVCYFDTSILYLLKFLWCDFQVYDWYCDCSLYMLVYAWCVEVLRSIRTIFNHLRLTTWTDVITAASCCTTTSFITSHKMCCSCTHYCKGCLILLTFITSYKRRVRAVRVYCAGCQSYTRSSEGNEQGNAVLDPSWNFATMGNVRFDMYHLLNSGLWGRISLRFWSPFFCWVVGAGMSGKLYLTYDRDFWTLNFGMRWCLILMRTHRVVGMNNASAPDA